MARKRVPNRQIILKKNEKLAAVAAALPPSASPEEFVTKFKELYPNDWDNIGKRYRAHERISRGKSHPMPEPDKYLSNIVKTFLKNRAPK